MRLSLRLLIPLLIVIGIFAYGAVPVADALMLRWFVRDLDIRSTLIATAMQEPLASLAAAGSTPRIRTFFNRMLKDERLYAIGLCLDGRGEPVATANFPREIHCTSLSTFAGPALPVLHSPRGLLHVAVHPLKTDDGHAGDLVLIHDMSFIERRNAAPTRAIIEDYRECGERAHGLAAAVNARYADAAYPPIALLAEHHEPDAVYEFHRAADLCFVSSQHDGMNLVAKEFVAARDDEHGVLILSQFAGASRDLPEAPIVNPYDADQCAAALHVALTMSPEDQRNRMRFMRGVVREFNVYCWAGRMLLDAAVMRQRGQICQTDSTAMARSRPGGKNMGSSFLHDGGIAAGR